MRSAEIGEMDAEREAGSSGRGSGTPVEVIVHSRGSDPRLRRSKSMSNTREASNMGDDAEMAGDMSAIYRARSKGEQFVNSGTFLMEELRLAMRDERRVERLIAQAEKHSEESWGKALLWASASGQDLFITKFMNHTPHRLKSLLRTAKDGDGFTSLHRAVVARNKDTVKLLISHGQGAQVTHSEHFEILHARTPEGWTALHLASVVGDEDIVQVLKDSYDSYKITALLPASSWDFCDNFWLTPLHYAVLGNSPAVIKVFMDWGDYERYVNAHDYYFRTPVHMACCNVDNSLIEILMSNPKVDLNAVDCCLNTPLHWAVYFGATETVRSLITESSNRTIRTTEEDVEGKPVLQIAIENLRIDRRVGKDIQKLLCTCAPVKDEVDRLYRDRQVYVDAANAILVGAALIASVTFGGWLQPPRGDDSGEAHWRLRLFWSLNSLSFFFSTATVIAGAGAVLPVEDVYIGHAVSKIRRALALTSFLLIVSVVLGLGAFGASGFASLTSVPDLTKNMIVTTSIGAAVCAVILLWFLRRLYRIRPHWARSLQSIVKKFDFMNSWGGGRGLVDIHKELEAAAMRARRAIQMKTHGTDQKIPQVDLSDLARILGSACEKEALLRRQVNDQPFSTRKEIEDEGAARPGIRMGKEEVTRQRVVAFEEAYQRARMPGHNVLAPSWNMLVLNNLSSRGMHYWVDDWRTSYCREHCLKKDADTWARVRDKLLIKKVSKLQEECEKFEYGILAFEDWSV